MAKKDKEEKLTPAEKILKATDSWLGRNGKLILIIGIVVLVVVIAVAAFAIVSNNNNKKLYNSYDNLISEYDEYIALDGDNEEYESKKAQLINNAIALSNTNKKKYPSAKANMLLGDISYDDKDYDVAIAYYNNVITNQKDTYLVQIALMNLASCYEEQNKLSYALATYTRVYDEYGKSGIYASRALFNEARINEKLGNIELAIDIYQTVADEYKDYQSEYSKLAETRVSQLSK